MCFHEEKVTLLIYVINLPRVNMQNSSKHIRKAYATSHPHTVWKVSEYGVLSGPYFPVFGMNTEIYAVNHRIQSEFGKIRTRKNLDTFHAVSQYKAFHSQQLRVQHFTQSTYFCNSYFQSIDGNTLTLYDLYFFSLYNATYGFSDDQKQPFADIL